MTTAPQHILTINADATAETWWTAARAVHLRQVPADLRSLVRDPQCIRATVSDASLAWCRALPGWSAKPLTVSKPTERPAQLLVRLPHDVHARIVAAAAGEKQSVNAWVRDVLTAAAGANR